MIKATMQYLRGDLLASDAQEVNRQNRMAIRYLAMGGLPVSLANAAAQIIMNGGALPEGRSLWILIYFAALNVIDRLLIPWDCKHATTIAYLAEAPVMLLSILLGTVWDPGRQAITFMLFMGVMPVFILDKPLRVMGITLLWTLLFMVMCVSYKPPAVQRADSFHALEFLLSSFAVTCVVVRLRSDVVGSFARTRYHLEHDTLTATRNRRSLESRMDVYTGKALVVIMANMDMLSLINDFYGHELGDEILCTFASTLKSLFGEAHTYRYGGDELLCIAVGENINAVLKRLETCRERMASAHFEKQPASLSCSFGYTTGTPEDAETLRGMVQLADIHVHRARKSGQGATSGEPFDPAALRAGMLESNMRTYARTYEINQVTGLPAMSYFIARSEDVLRHVVDPAREPVVGYLDVVRLRDFNDAFGYAEGDRLIRFAAGQLQRHFPARHVASISGSQFAILCYKGEVEPGMRRIAEALAQFKPGYTVEIKAGFAACEGGASVLLLLDKARVAQKSIRDRRDCLYCMYDAELDAAVQFNQYIVTHVDEAIEKGWLKLFYQPIARAVTGQVCNEEALSRWDDPTYGFLMPGRFIPPLEKSGLMYKVNLFAVRQALRDFERRRAMGIPVVPVSVNLSRRDFEQCDMVREIVDMVDASGFPRSLISIEITESAFMTNQELLKREIARFRENGFEVWMDDFGSEYSTLNLLQEITFDVIKIDMRFMADFSTSGRNYIIVSHIIDMAKQMGVTTLVEGIETREQYAMVQQLGCEKLQGFLFNRPNDFDYIARRALNGTGLRFEDPAAAPYYAAICRVDLNDPMSKAEAGIEVGNAICAGILERRDGACDCLRATESFLRAIEPWGLRDTSEGYIQFRMRIEALPEALAGIMARGEQAPGWVSETVALPPGKRVTVFLRRLTGESYQGGIAMLTILLND